MSSPKRLILIDGHALIYRAFYAIPTLTTKEGIMVNAVYGFLRILLAVVKDFNPEYIAVTFDMPKPTFRHADFAGYKAQRKEMPEDLQGQIQLVRDCVEVLNIPQFGVEGYEADDLIGTLAKQAVEGDLNHQSVDVLIVTGDRDSFQLVTDHVHVLVPAQGKNGEQEFDPAAVEAKMGIKPDQIVDYKALSGDASDNIPGIAGIGPKTAVRLLQEFGTLENIYQHIKDQTDKVKNSKVLKGATLTKVAEGYESAIMSQKLATIDRNVPIKITLDDCRVSGYDKATAIAKFEDFGFKSLIKWLPDDDFEKDVAGLLF